jgi:hypothetical protein
VPSQNEHSREGTNTANNTLSYLLKRALSFHSQRFPAATRQTESSPLGMKRLFPRRKLEVVENMVDELGFPATPTSLRTT